MKRSVSFIALLALVVMVGCGGDSPSAKPVPTVVPTAWGMPSLSASSLSPLVGTVIQVDAQVTRDGSPAPDGTAVEFSSTGPGTVFGFTGGLITKGDLILEEDVTVLTEGGYATTFFTVVAANETENPAGTYLIQARATNVVQQLNVQYQASITTDRLQLFSIDPRRGSYTGGESAVITGIGIQTPIEVYFDLNGIAYQAIIAGVVESVPLSETGSITVVTPAFTGANNSIQQSADVRVIANAGTGSQETSTLSSAWVLLPGGGAQIFGVSPSSGRSSGGEIVNILGQNFGSVASDLSVSFTDDTNVVRLGSVISVAPDGTQIQVETPRFSTLPLEEDQPQDVAVSTLDGGTTLEDVFIVLADNPQPDITSISPTAGPLDGGTLVTIFGNGFQAPMQVFFGDLEATDVNIFDDNSPANQDRVTCVSPNYSQQEETPPVAVDVRVVATNTGAESSYSSFTYGDNLYISGNSPQDGNADDLVIIYGSGFVSPLQVFFADTQMQVLSVSGTEVVVRIPDDFIDECSPSSGTFKIVLLESNLEAEGGDFTILGNTPGVFSVSPVVIAEGSLPNIGTVVNPAMTVSGERFAENVLVTIGAYNPPSSDVNRVSATTVDILVLPTAGEIIGGPFDSETCTVSVPGDGRRNTATPVNVSVANLPGNCSDTITAAFVIEPDNLGCVVATPPPDPTITIDIPSFDDADAGPPASCTSGTLRINNFTADSTLEVSGVSVLAGGRFSFTDTPGSLTLTDPSAPYTINGPAGFQDVPMYFCPNNNDGGTYNGTVRIVSDAGTSPDEVTLTGIEAHPVMSVSPLSIDFGTDPLVLTRTFDVDNNGSVDLNWTANTTGLTEFSLSDALGTVAPGDSQTVTVTYTDNVGTHSESVTITADEADAQGSPQQVTITAETT